MILVDTSVWINHHDCFNDELAALIQNDSICCHNFIIGELAVGSIKNRQQFLADLKELPNLSQVPHEDVLQFIEMQKLYATGLSYIDIHLLASCVLEKCKIYTLDKKLVEFAKKLDVNY